MENQLQLVENIKRVEYRDQLVLTTAQLAEFYETTAENLRVNFSYAQKNSRFVEDKHYFKVEGDELENLRVRISYPQISPMTRTLYLWTKRGAARHAKMLNTDRAWEVFEALEDNYFNRPVAVDNQFVILERERLNLERDRLNFEREQFNLANSEESKTMAKVQLLRELASASKDDFLRYDLVQYAAKLLIGEDFVNPTCNRRRIIR